MNSPRARTNRRGAVGRGLRIAALLFAAFQTPPAGAQVPPALTFPRAEGSTDVPYPEGASGDAAVLLELVVEADGAVSSAVVVEGEEPFAGRARAAAWQWRFTPAQRDGAPVSARVRARVDFHEAPPPHAPEAAAPSPAGPAPAPPTSPTDGGAPRAVPEPPPEPPLDVTIAGRRREPGQTTLSDADVREMPGAFGDPFRAIEALPGVIPVASGLPYFFVRGAPPNNNGYLRRRHSGPAAVPPRRRARRHPPGPHRSGGLLSGRGSGQLRRRRRRASSPGRPRDPAPTLHGVANLRLIDAGALVESPVGSGRGRVLVAGRYGYPGPILGRDHARGEARATGITRSRATWRLSARGRALACSRSAATTTWRHHPRRPIRRPADRTVRLRLSPGRPALRPRAADGRLRIALTGGHDRQGAAPTYVKDAVGGAARGGRGAGIARPANSWRRERAPRRLRLHAESNRARRSARPLHGRSASHQPDGRRPRRHFLAGHAAHRADAGSSIRYVRVVARPCAGRRHADPHDGARVRSAPLGPPDRDAIAGAGVRRGPGPPVPGVARRQPAGAGRDRARVPERRAAVAEGVAGEPGDRDRSAG